MAEAPTNRRLAAILAADVVGYSRMMASDEAGTLAALKRHREVVFDPAVAEHGGRIVKLMGDGVLVEFGSVVDAVKCALAVQRSAPSSQPEASLQITHRQGRWRGALHEIETGGPVVASQHRPARDSVKIKGQDGGDEE